MSQEQLCQQKQIPIANLHRWRKKYGQMDEADAKRLKALEREKESTELKKMYAEAMRGIKILQETIEKAVSAAHRQACRVLRLHRSTYRSSNALQDLSSDRFRQLPCDNLRFSSLGENFLLATRRKKSLDCALII